MPYPYQEGDPRYDGAAHKEAIETGAVVMTDTVALAQACLDGEAIGMSASDLIEDMMHEIVGLRRDNANLEHHYKCHRDANADLHTKYCELRGLVMKMQRMANEAVGDLDVEIEREHNDVDEDEPIF